MDICSYNRDLDLGEYTFGARAFAFTGDIFSLSYGDDGYISCHWFPLRLTFFQS